MTFHNLNTLYDALLNDLNETLKTGDVFSVPELIIVPNLNVANRLKRKLADRFGLTMLHRFILPETFILEVIRPYKQFYEPFSKGYLRYHILNLLEDPMIPLKIKSYYEKDYQKKYDYAKTLEDAFIHYQTHANHILDNFSKAPIITSISSVETLEIYIYQSLVAKGYKPLNDCVDEMLDYHEKVRFISDGKPLALLQKLLNKTTNLTMYECVPKSSHTTPKLLKNWSKIREMEAVWDLVTNTLETTNYKMDDILVLFPDVSTYQAAIDYVFTKSVIEKINYNYSIQLPNSNEHVLHQFLTRLSSEINYRHEARSLFELFMISIGLKYPRISKSEIDLVKSWIMDNAIRNQIEAVNSAPDFTWETGLDQLILGFMMLPDTFDNKGSYAAKNVSTSSAELLFELYGFIQMIKRLRDEKLVDLTQLNTLINEMVTMFFGSDEHEDSLSSYILNVWQNLLTKKLSILDNIPTISVVLTMLNESLSLNPKSNITSGGITFGNIKDFHMVDAKYKIVCGLDDLSYPVKSKDTTLNLDLNKVSLDTLSQQTLFNHLVFDNIPITLSYVGVNETNKKEITRSIFMDTILNGNVKVIHHKLQPFDSKYFSGLDDDFYTYDMRYETSQLHSQKSPFDVSVSYELTQKRNLNEMLNVFKNPVKSFYKNVLKITYPEKDKELIDSPYFYLSGSHGLETHTLKDVVFKASLVSNLDTLKKAQLKGQVPYENFGEIELDKIRKTIQTMLPDIEDSSRFEMMDKTLNYQNYTLYIPLLILDKKTYRYIIPEISKIQDEKDFRLDKIFLKYAFQALMLHLVEKMDVEIRGLNKKGEAVTYDEKAYDLFLDVSKEKRSLDQLLDYYWDLKEKLETKLYLIDLSLVKGIDKLSTRLSSSDLKGDLVDLSLLEPYQTYLDQLDNNGRGLRHYDTYFENILDGIYSLDDFIDKYGLEILDQAIDMLEKIKKYIHV